MKKKLTKSFLSVVLVLSMMFGMSIVSSAATVQTDTYSCNGGTYTLYVRNPGNNNVIGYMVLSRSTDKTKANNTFTAAQDCKTTTPRVKHNSSSVFNSVTVAALSKDRSVTATQTGSNITMVYGNCTVNY